ncbi:MAG: VOC family protein [Burkholderiaceae bacterium]
MTPSLDRIDHIHVYVADREVAEQWYGDVLGLLRVPELEPWAADGGPLTVANAAGTIHLALFERKPQPTRSTVAFGVTAPEFVAWRRHLVAALDAPAKVDDHQLSWSLYFSDPDGNPFEITTYDYDAVAKLS